MGGFWGTGAMSFIGAGAKAVREKVLFPEAPEMTDLQKKELDMNVDMFKTEHNDLMAVKEGVINFGEPTYLFKKDPFGNLYQYKDYPINIRTNSADNLQDQAAIMMDYLQVPDDVYNTWTEDKQQEILSYATNAGLHYEYLMNHDSDGKRKETRLSAAWDEIFPNLEKHEWIRNSLYAMSDNQSLPENKVLPNKVPFNYLEKIYAAKHGDDAIVDEKALVETESEHKNSIHNWYNFKYGSLPAGNEDSIVVRGSAAYAHFAEFWPARDILMTDYVLDKYGGQAFSGNPNVSTTRAINVWGEVSPYVYRAAAEEGTEWSSKKTRDFHKYGIDLYKSVFSTKEIASANLGLTSKEIYKGGYDKALAFKELDQDPKEIAKVAASYNNFVIVHDLLEAELSGDFALSGKFPETIALGLSAAGGARQQLQGILNRIKTEFTPDKNPFIKGGLLNSLTDKASKVFDEGLTDADKAWLESRGMTKTEIDAITREDFIKASETDLSTAQLRQQASKKTQMLASIARQKALTITLTYLAAATIQGEGGKAISDHDQKKVEAALSYGWWSTPEMRLEAIGALHDSLSLYGEIALAYNQATDAGDVYAINEYSRVAGPFDIMRASNGAGRGSVRGQEMIPDKNLPETTSDGSSSGDYISHRDKSTKTVIPFNSKTWELESNQKYIRDNWDTFSEKNQEKLIEWGFKE